MKKHIALALEVLLSLFLLLPLSAQKDSPNTYQIKSVTYDVRGLTNPGAIERFVSVDTKKTFASKEELEAYIQTIKVQLENLRQFEDINLTYTELSEENSITPVTVVASMKDSFHLLALPYVTYNSNSGLTVKVKLKDTNFLGLLEPLNTEATYLINNNQEHHIGLNASYNFPFKTGILQNSFNNSFSFDWCIGEATPDLSYSTGLSTAIPLGPLSLQLSFTQSLAYKNEYTAHGDSFYLTEGASVSLPVSLGKIADTISVTYTPSATFTYHWDPIDSVINTADLYGPTFGLRQAISASDLTWKTNLREGFTFTAGSGASWNFRTEQISANADIDLKLYKAWKYAGITTSFYLYTAYNTTTRISDMLRGTRDSQAQVKTAQALVFKLDVPVHIITTDWVGWGLKLFGPYEERNGFLKVMTWIPNKLFPYLDFELQLSPFIDVALTENAATGRTFFWKDGFYNAGIEVLVHPASWKSYVVRASFGVDVGRAVLSRFIDTSWRNNVPKWELFIGLGLEY
ncbi:MAG: hypothetical protein IIT68_04555 [Treponema sp.]|nr:hypothetical protein [Treponema sp.]